jgi:hypothetical protein
MKIIDRIKQFYKQAQSQIASAQLLTEVLKSGDKSTYLVFLDKLEEENEDLKKELIKLTKLDDILNKLSSIYPSILAFEHYTVYFNAPVMNGIFYIRLNPFNQDLSSIEYQNFGVKITGNRVYFLPKKIINGIPIRSITKYRDELLLSPVDHKIDNLDEHTENELMYLEDQANTEGMQAVGLEILNTCLAQAKKDFEQFKGIFL